MLEYSLNLSEWVWIVIGLYFPAEWKKYVFITFCLSEIADTIKHQGSSNFESGLAHARALVEQHCTLHHNDYPFLTNHFSRLYYRLLYYTVINLGSWLSHTNCQSLNRTDQTSSAFELNPSDKQRNSVSPQGDLSQLTLSLQPLSWITVKLESLSWISRMSDLHST